MIIKISEKIKKIPIDNPEKIAKVLVNVLNMESKLDKEKEHLWGIYFNARSNIKRIELISLGTLDANLVHPREVYRPAIESAAASLIVIHNHPSRNMEPSEADLIITKRLEEAGKILGIDLLDHIIIEEKGKFFSFKDNKLI